MTKELFIKTIAMHLVSVGHSPRVSDCKKIATQVVESLEERKIALDESALLCLGVAIENPQIPNVPLFLVKSAISLSEAYTADETKLEDMTVAQLEAFAGARGIDLSGAKNKADKLDAINAALAAA